MFLIESITRRSIDLAFSFFFFFSFLFFFHSQERSSYKIDRSVNNWQKAIHTTYEILRLMVIGVKVRQVSVNLSCRLQFYNYDEFGTDSTDF